MHSSTSYRAIAPPTVLVAALLFVFSACDTVDDPPTDPIGASFEFSCDDLTCTFEDTSTGDVASWNWDFGDGETSTDTNPTHEYQSGGTYTVTLTVTSPEDATDTATEEITVSEPGDPVFTLEDIDGSWQQEDEGRRYLDIQSDENGDGVFYEAFFQDDEDEFEVVDCYFVVRNEVIDTNEGQFTFRSTDNDTEEEVVIRFEVDTSNDAEPQRIRMIREDGTFDAWFQASDLTVDDFEPRCEDLEDDED